MRRNNIGLRFLCFFFSLYIPYYASCSQNIFEKIWMHRMCVLHSKKNSGQVLLNILKKYYLRRLNSYVVFFFVNRLLVGTLVGHSRFCPDQMEFLLVGHLKNRLFLVLFGSSLIGSLAFHARSCFVPCCVVVRLGGGFVDKLIHCVYGDLYYIIINIWGNTLVQRGKPSVFRWTLFRCPFIALHT